MRVKLARVTLSYFQEATLEGHDYLEESLLESSYFVHLIRATRPPSSALNHTRKFGIAESSMRATAYMAIR